jgi:hypothetical protein
MLLEDKLPNHFWAEAINTTIYLLNCGPTRVLDSKATFKTCYGHELVHFVKVGYRDRIREEAPTLLTVIMNNTLDL